jgi:hypothetical protein
MTALIASLSLLAGCAAQIEQKMKTVVLLSPESVGEKRIGMGIGFQDAPMVTITDNAVARPPDAAVSRIENQGRLYLHGEIGLPGRADLSIDPASWLNAKWQFLGDTFADSKAGNVALSALGSIWYEKDDGMGSDVEFGQGVTAVVPDVHFEKKMFAWRLGVLGGYRLWDPLLLYGGVFHQSHRYNGGYEIIGRSRGRFAGHATATSASLGLELAFSKSFVMRLEDSYSVAKVKAFNAKSSQHAFGLLLAGTFGIGE